jgi:hypothetical protein
VSSELLFDIGSNLSLERVQRVERFSILSRISRLKEQAVANRHGQLPKLSSGAFDGD